MSAFLALVVAGAGFVVLLAGAIAIGLAYLAVDVAAEKGRSQLGWALLALIAGGAGGTAGAALAWYALEGDSPSSLALFTTLLPPFLAGAAAAGVVALLGRLAPRAPRGVRWPVFRFSGAAAGGDGVLELGAAELCFRADDRLALVVPLAAVVETRADGECVRLDVRAGERRERIVFLPTLGPENRAFRAHLSASIARRIGAAASAADVRRGR